MRERGRRGAALLLVLLLVALLSVMVVEFQREAWVERRAAQTLADDLQAHAILRSGVELSRQMLAVYSNPQYTMRDIKNNLEAKVLEGKLIWSFLGGAQSAFPVPPGFTGQGGLQARLDDLFGRFPLGALADAATSEARRGLLQDYFERIREYRSYKELPVEALSRADPAELAQALWEHFQEKDDAEAPPVYAVLREVSDFTPELIQEVASYFDSRTEWRFNMNGLSPPLLMMMLGKGPEDAESIRLEIMEEPLVDEAEMTQRGFRPAGAEYPNDTFVGKSRGFELLFEAEVGGVVRRGRAVFRKGDPQSPGGHQAEEPKFKLAEWAEGWVEAWPSDWQRLDAEEPEVAGGEK